MSHVYDICSQIPQQRYWKFSKWKPLHKYYLILYQKGDAETIPDEENNPLETPILDQLYTGLAEASGPTKENGNDTNNNNFEPTDLANAAGKEQICLNLQKKLTVCIKNLKNAYSI